MKIFATWQKNRTIKSLLFLLVVFVVLDGVLTQFLINGGGDVREGNPLLQPLVGDVGFIFLKAAGALLCAFILWDIYRRFPKVAVIAAWVAVVGYGAIVLWNSSLFLIV